MVSASHSCRPVRGLTETPRRISADTWADTGIVYGNSTNPTGNNANGCVGEIFRLKKENRNMKVLLSIGGYNWSPHFVPAAATPEGRQRFASSAVKLMADWGFDGLDIDWEYPEDEIQAGHYVLLLKACREALDNYAEEHDLDHHFEITIATSAGPDKYNKMNLKDMDPYIDAWHLMSYDYAGSWDLTASGHQAALFADKENKATTMFNTEDAVAAYVAKGIQPHKIALGIPLYGRSFMGTQVIGGPFSGPGEGSIEKGIWLYKDLPRPGVEEIYDEDIVGAYSFDENTKEFVSYDNVESTEYKVEWLVGQGLGGVMFWQASGDKPCEGSLVETAANALPKLDDTPNLLHYPDSVYDNIRNGGDDCDEDYGPSTGSTGSSNSAFSSGLLDPSKRPASSGTPVSSKPSAPSGGSAPSKPPASSGSLASSESPGCSESPESSGSPESAASTLPSST
ncbi:glycoside hydrolase family 18 protein [Candidatus Bathyarchaeota archaeon]|nr:glycoside hydrolase family 18 protein [Candidatus Bathyarchaeota archaeon]